MPPSLAKCGRRLGVPVLGRDDDRPAVAARLDLALTAGTMASPPATLRLAGRVREIVLDVDHDQGRPRADSAACPERTAVAPARRPAGTPRPTR